MSRMGLGATFNTNTNDWYLQPYETDGGRGRRYWPPTDDGPFKRKADAELARREILAGTRVSESYDRLLATPRPRAWVEHRMTEQDRADLASMIQAHRRLMAEGGPGTWLFVSEIVSAAGLGADEDRAAKLFNSAHSAGMVPG